MAYPTTIDDFTNPIATNGLNSPSHATQHTNENNAIEALEAKVGADGSAVTSSHDYKIAQLESGKAPLNSPTFTGTPSLPTGTTAVTQLANNNSTKIATTAYADTKFTLPALTSGSVIFSNGSTLSQDNNTLFWDNTNKNLGVGTKTFLSTGNVFQGYGTSTATIQGNVQNASSGTSASSDWIATANTGTNSTNYIDVGINSSTYNDTSFNIGGALGGYLYNLGGDLTVGTGTASKVVKIHTGGTTSSNLRATVSDTSFTVETPGTATKCVATVDATQTLTNKRPQPRTYSTTSVATLTPEVDTYNVFVLTAQAQALTIANHSTSTVANGEMILIRMTCDSTARALTFGTNYVFKMGTTAPTTLVASKMTTLIGIWCSEISKYNMTVCQE